MHRNGVPFVGVLAHPATGAVWSALADQADIILAEPGARVGLGSRPVDAESAESLLAGGMIDGVVSRPELRRTLTRLFGVFAGRGAFRPIYGETVPAHARRRSSPVAGSRLGRGAAHPSSLPARWPGVRDAPGQRLGGAAR